MRPTSAMSSPAALAALLLASALPLPAFNPPASQDTRNKPADNTPRADCNTSKLGGKLGCLSLRIRFGRVPHAPELSAGYVALEYDRACPEMYTPRGLAYRLFVFSKIRGVSGSDVEVEQANGTRVTYRFPAGGSVAAPVGRETGFLNRLQRLDAYGNPAGSTSSTAWYDHWYSDGSRARLSAATGKSVSVTTAAGRAVTPADCGVSFALDADGGLRQAWSEADGLADVAVVQSNAAFEIRLYAPGCAGAATR